MAAGLTAGMNIWSGSRGLGGALTNPTWLAKRKGTIQGDYPVTFRGRTFADAEAAYQAFKPKAFEAREALCAEVIEAKLLQHPRLLEAITARNGVAWLERCRHETGARTEHFQRWEGQGRQSPFIRALILAYERALGLHAATGDSQP